MANISGFSNNDYDYYKPQRMRGGVNRNNDYFPNYSTPAIIDTLSYKSLTATSGVTATNIITSASGTGDFSFGEGTHTFKISGNYVLNSETSDFVYEPYIKYTNDFKMDSGTTSGTGIYSSYNELVTSGSNSDPYFIHTGSSDSLHFGSEKDIAEIQKEIKRQNIRNNLMINIKSRANLIRNIPENEQVAIESLREEITETEFRKYLKYGFVLVKGQSGKTYQVFRNRSHTKVWKGGKIIEEVCVRLKNYKIPPTDNVIAFLNMIQIDEEEFRKMGNIYKMQRAA